MLTPISCIYVCLCTTTNKRYIGSALNGLRRYKEHIDALKKERHHNRYLQNAWKKHGEAVFTWAILEECVENDLLDREQHWINHFDSANSKFGFNIAYPVKQRNSSKRMSAAHKAYWNSLTDEERLERVAYLGTEDLQVLATAGKQTKVARERASKQMVDQWANNPKFREVVVNQLRARLSAQLADPEKWAPIGAKISAKAVARWEEPEYRERGLKQIKEASDKARAILDDPVKMQERLDLLASVRDKAAAAIRARWADPEFRARRTAQMRKPRKTGDTVK